MERDVIPGLVAIDRAWCRTEYLSVKQTMMDSSPLCPELRAYNAKRTP
jgi:hypothetical protein